MVASEAHCGHVLPCREQSRNEREEARAKEREEREAARAAERERKRLEALAAKRYPIDDLELLQELADRAEQYGEPFLLLSFFFLSSLSFPFFSFSVFLVKLICKNRALCLIMRMSHIRTPVHACHLLVPSCAQCMSSADGALVIP